uniref:Tetraspanin-6 n=1 Tax=Aceria tosichella TaxID=561515 RepID=A0A6G1SI23_9ACAR
MLSLEDIGRYVSYSAKRVLFIVGMIVILSSILMLGSSHKGDNSILLELADASIISSFVMSFGIYLIVIAAVCVFAAYVTNIQTIKLLTLMMVLNVAISVGLLVSSSYKFNNVESKLDASQAKYDWSHNQNSPDDIKMTTKAWDDVQTSMRCCGIRSSEDWKIHRPPGHKDESILPISCCYNKPEPNQPYCDESTISNFAEGCAIGMEFRLKVMNLSLFFFACFSFVISILLGLVLYYNSEFEHN